MKKSFFIFFLILQFIQNSKAAIQEDITLGYARAQPPIKKVVKQTTVKPVTQVVQTNTDPEVADLQRRAAQFPQEQQNTVLPKVVSGNCIVQNYYMDKALYFYFISEKLTNTIEYPEIKDLYVIGKSEYGYPILKYLLPKDSIQEANVYLNINESLYKIIQLNNPIELKSRIEYQKPTPFSKVYHATFIDKSSLSTNRFKLLDEISNNIILYYDLLKDRFTIVKKQSFWEALLNSKQECYQLDDEDFKVSRLEYKKKFGDMNSDYINIYELFKNYEKYYYLYKKTKIEQPKLNQIENDVSNYNSTLDFDSKIIISIISLTSLFVIYNLVVIKKRSFKKNIKELETKQETNNNDENIINNSQSNVKINIS